MDQILYGADRTSVWSIPKICLEHPAHLFGAARKFVWSTSETLFGAPRKTVWSTPKICLEQAKKSGKKIKALVVINPGNPTGAVLQKNVMNDILDFADQNQIVFPPPLS